MTAGSKNVNLLVRNMAFSVCIIHAGGRTYNGIAEVVVRKGKRFLG